MVFGGEGRPLPGSRPQGAQLSEQSSPHSLPVTGALNKCANCKAICTDPDGQTVKSVVAATTSFPPQQKPESVHFLPRQENELLLSFE